jgi:glycosyltransferase involved in cell wall biosynthesis
MSSKIAVLLDGPVANDGRVMRTIGSLSEICEIDLYYLDGNPEDDKLFKSNVKLFSFNADKGYLKSNLLFHLKFSQLRKELLSNCKQYQVVYCNDYPLLFTAVSAKRRNDRLKVIYDSHEIYIETINQFFPTRGYKAIYGFMLIKINRVFHSILERRLMRSVDYLVTVCESFSNYFKNKYNLENVLVVKNCPDIEIYPERNHSIHDLLGLKKESKIILYQGHLNSGRGIEKMILAGAYLDDNINIVIIGSGHLQNYFMKLVEESGVENFYFIDKVPFSKLLDYTASADLGILLIQPINLSKELTLPNKVFEYMVAGIPFVTNHLPESNDIIKEVDCGYAIDDTNPEEIAKAFERILQDDEKLKEKGLKGSRAIKKKYNWNSEVIKLKTLMLNLEEKENSKLSV